jgi:hypothetical protein
VPGSSCFWGAGGQGLSVTKSAVSNTECAVSQLEPFQSLEENRDTNDIFSNSVNREGKVESRKEKLFLNWKHKT